MRFSGALHGVRTVAQLIVVVGLSMVLGSVVAPLVGCSSAVITGGSMQPGIRRGDIVVHCPISPDQVQPGQILVVDNPSRPGTQLTHRVVNINPARTVTLKGDANREPDRAAVSADQVEGMVRVVTPAVGLPAVWTTEGQWRLLAWAGFAVLGVFCVARARIDGPTTPRVDGLDASVSAEDQSGSTMEPNCAQSV